MQSRTLIHRQQHSHPYERDEDLSFVSKPHAIKLVESTSELSARMAREAWESSQMNREMVYTVVVVTENPVDEAAITDPIKAAGFKIESLKWAVRRTATKAAPKS